jgi:hypothetical protein
MTVSGFSSMISFPITIVRFSVVDPAAIGGFSEKTYLRVN